LWKLLGGQVREKVRAYNTDIGWLSIPDDKPWWPGPGARWMKASPASRSRSAPVSSAMCGGLSWCARHRPRHHLAVDGNGKWDLPTCLRFCRAAEPLDVYWFEEPLWYDDVKGHAELARATRIPVALGEQLYTQDAFSEFFHQNAIHWVQPDVTRMAGITEVLRVCETAHSYRLPVAPHAGDMSQVHVHLSYAHPAVQVLEYIPWIKDCFTDPAEVTADALARFSRPAG
jgi:L-alanine-DL-glutamate epimerase-like enolase superfamily enzyme